MSSVHEVYPPELYGDSPAALLRSAEAFDALPDHLRVAHGEPVKWPAADGGASLNVRANLTAGAADEA